MKQSAMCTGFVLVACAWSIGSTASAKPWWANPVLKYDEATVNISGSVDPHYMNKDESDQYLFFSAVPGGTGYLYSMPALIAASSPDAVAPIASAVSANYYGNWKTAAISDDLLRVLTGSAGAPIMENASLPLTAPWTKDVNVFAITNDPTTVEFDGADFSHNSAYLYSDNYTGTETPAWREIYKWNVVNLTSGGIGLTSNTVFETTVNRVRNVSAYYIGGQDLLYYGDGTYSASSTKVCVLDPSTGTETVLVNVNTLVASAVTNVKVSGVGLGQMHLYVQCDKGNILVFELGADGKSVGALVRSFSPAQTAKFLGAASAIGNMRCFEVTNDEKYAFVSYHGAGGFFVLMTRPQGTVLKAL